MSILDIPAPPAPISFTIAEHPRHLVRAYRRSGRVVWVTIQPTRFFRVIVMHGYKTSAQAVVTFHF